LPSEIIVLFKLIQCDRAAAATTTFRFPHSTLGRRCVAGFSLCRRVMTSIGPAGLCGRKSGSCSQARRIYVANPSFRTAYMSFRLCGRNQVCSAVEQQDSTGRDSGMHAHALCASALIITKRSQAVRPASAAILKEVRKLLFIFSMSLTCMLLMTARRRRPENRPPLRVEFIVARRKDRSPLVDFCGSIRSSTERCCADRALSMPSRLSPRLRFRKFEMCAV